MHNYFNIIVLNQVLLKSNKMLFFLKKYICLFYLYKKVRYNNLLILLILLVLYVQLAHNVLLHLVLFYILHRKFVKKLLFKYDLLKDYFIQKETFMLNSVMHINPWCSICTIKSKSVTYLI